MTAILTPVRGRQLVYRINPVAKLLASMIITIGILLSIDWVSASVALAFELVLCLWSGLSARRLLARTWPILVAAVFAGVTILLYGSPSGATYARFLFVHITDGSIEFSIATTLRVIAVALPAVVLFVTIDPTELGDGLAQLLKLPSRFVIGGLAGFRLVGLFLDDWRSLELARRARGVADSGKLRRLASMAFSLLVLSIRRGSKLATAMEARGFGGPAKRTWARTSTFGWPGAGLVIIAFLVAAVSIAAAVMAGSWNFLGSG
ncbi:MAG: transporter [Glaciihabitans sp.]|nr:transporter [Glaciihabitans sp.]MDQ1570736.1 energy-coupling factor transport system permease protein [Actinomycetota bacterium]